MESEDDIQAAIRRITEKTRALRRELEAMLRNRSRESRAFSADVRRREHAADRLPSLAKRLGSKR
jgi:uncharacterized protein Yka (UPF0111/DUF47 family)